MYQELKNSGDEFYLYGSATDQGLKDRMDATYAQSITYNQSFWTEADLDARFEAGDQSVWDAYLQNAPSWQRKLLSFNRIRPVINMVDGYQRRNRKSTVVVPQENGDQETADQYSKLLLWSMGQDQTLETISDAFRGALVTGFNLLSTWMDFRNDPVSGDLRVDRIPYNSFLIDPFFKKMDLSDCNYVWVRKWLSKEQLLGILPSHREEIMAMTPPRGGFDGKFQYQPESYNYPSAELFTFDEYWYRSSRTVTLLCDLKTGETSEWQGTDEQLKEFRKAYPQIITMNHEIPTVKLGIRVQDRVMYHGPNPGGIDEFPFVPVIGYYNPEIAFFPWRMQGMVRGLRDAQYLYNRRKMIELDMLESQINSGFKYKENALVNPQDIFLNGQGKGLAIKSEANMSDVEQIPPPIVPQSTLELSQILAEEITRISGVNEELLGSAQDDKAGVLSMLRQGAGLTTLQKLFDQLDQSQKLLGRIQLRMIQANWSPGKVQRILEEQPAPQFYSQAFGKYDSAIEEGLNTSTQRQMQFAQLMELQSLGIQVPPDLLIQASTIQDKTELVEAIKMQNEQQQQIAQMQIQAQMAEQEAKTDDLQARAKANAGLGLERASRVQENRALAQERLSQAERDRDEGVLAQVKALKELESMDIGEIERLLALQTQLKNLKSQEQVAEEQMVETPNIEEVAVAATGEENG